MDQKIIDKLQYGFPVCEYPFAVVAKDLGITESSLIDRIDTLLKEKVLTRFGPMYHAERMGGALSLAAMSIPEQDFDQVTEIVNAFPEIAHNYQRDHQLNMWFVLATEEQEQLEKTIERIEQQSGYPVYNMPKLEEFYVGFYLDLSEKQADTKPNVSVRPDRPTRDLTEMDRELVTLSQEGLALVPRPYHKLAEAMGTSSEEVMVRMESMLACGIIRRIAAVPNHYKLGYTANGMTVWDVPDEKIRELGTKVGALPSVTHCYHRPRHLPDWSYNLFAMVHGKNKSDVAEDIEQIKQLLGDDLRACDVLYSTRILKKKGLRIARSVPVESSEKPNARVEAT
ncbi:hypothetical protein MIB92_14950 [Aestuariirhabdus sp. Z084]|uniref:siroheme decarboxylase subunit beta n=1 Tax=Aestuariirhabdus haliotis TaxID=2918751 RepID=UPI00201B39B3|nr:Lrp/AsnC family transcriptional regulator [Aestuariirhabdus haliotis]MCL6416957.1 hypothetical protein [Aestuariirhabdus haliotis]MCL6420940.1 hypothetical protein [Aestuariirhabdus haliotis]